jgi:hypothetical protein
MTFDDASRQRSKSQYEAGERFSCSLTFELSGRQRWDARPGLVKMYSVPPTRAWWPAVGAPLERGVRPHSGARRESALNTGRNGFSSSREIVLSSLNSASSFCFRALLADFRSLFSAEVSAITRSVFSP